MRTRFDVVLHGDPDDTRSAEAAQLQTARLRALGEEAMAEIEAAEKRFNFFDPDSWLSRVNQRAASQAVRVPNDVYSLLKLCALVHSQTNGRFDPAAGSGSSFSQVDLNDEQRSVKFRHPQLQLDLGGIAKGWAIDLATEVLLDGEVTSALVQGGSSSLRAIGSPPGQRGWKVEIGNNVGTWLHNQALGVSHTFADDTSTEGPTCHIIDPVNGEALRQPQMAAVLCAVAADNSPDRALDHPAAVADAWSTALLLQHPQSFLWKQLP